MVPKDKFHHFSCRNHPRRHEKMENASVCRTRLKDEMKNLIFEAM